jgi:hypothetical protein
MLMARKEIRAPSAAEEEKSKRYLVKEVPYLAPPSYTAPL